jgi:hypothetical protein
MSFLGERRWLMAWVKIIAANSGGGMKRGKLSANLDGHGQFSITHAVTDMLGDPERVIVEVEPELQQIRLTPTTPGHKGAYALSGGGLSPRRFRSKEIVTRWPHLVGKYEPRKQAAAVLFVKIKEGLESVDKVR